VSQIHGLISHDVIFFGERLPIYSRPTNVIDKQDYYGNTALCTIVHRAVKKHAYHKYVMISVVLRMLGVRNRSTTLKHRVCLTSVAFSAAAAAAAASVAFICNRSNSRDHNSRR